MIENVGNRLRNWYLLGLVYIKFVDDEAKARNDYIMNRITEVTQAAFYENI